MHAATLTLLLLIRTYDVTGVSAADMQRAARVSADILRRVGIEVTWVDCSAHPDPADADSVRCADVAGATDVIVRMLAAGLAPGGSDVLGFAHVDRATRRGTLATIYADRVAGLARSSRTDFGTLLGRVVAHETGHLLLGTTAHHAQGLMRAHWSGREMRASVGTDWLFSRAEAEQIRERFGSRSTAVALPSLRGSS